MTVVAWSGRGLLALSLCVSATLAVAQEPERFWGGADLSLTRSNGWLGWSTAGPGYSPDILSELTWRDLRSHGIRFEGWGGVGALAGSLVLSSTQITDGNGQDSDYGADGRSSEFSRSVFDVTGDDSVSWSATVGWAPQWLRYQQWQLQVLGGYGRQELQLRMRNGVQTVSEPANVPPGYSVTPPPLGPFAGLDSTYTAIWYGPFLGGTLQGRLLPRLHVSADYRYHVAHYYGWGNWNLVSGFRHPKSFDHLANGTGKVLRLRLAVPVQQLDFFLVSEHQYWETTEGDSRFYLSDGSVPIQPLNPVIQRSWTLSAGISLSW